MFKQSPRTDHQHLLLVEATGFRDIFTKGNRLWVVPRDSTQQIALPISSLINQCSIREPNMYSGTNVAHTQGKADDAAACRLLLDPKTRQGFPLSEWTRQLQNEIDCYALTRQKLEKKIEDILERGAMTELRSAHAVIKHLERPMVEAIIREQRSVRSWLKIAHPLKSRRARML